LSSGSLQTRVLVSFTVNLSLVIMSRIVTKASAALPRLQITRSRVKEWFSDVRRGLAGAASFPIAVPQ
jgi:hypothetical protein